MCRRYVLLLLLSAVRIAAAGDWELPSDVGVTLTAAPTTELLPNEPIDVTFTVTNYGQDELPVVIAQSETFVDELNVVSVNPSECFLFLIVGDLSNGGYDYILDWDVASAYSGIAPALEPGETRVCHFQIALTQYAPPSYTFSFGLPDFFHDPNPANDRGSVVLQRAEAAPVQLPALSPTGLYLLAGLSMSAGLATLRHRPVESPLPKAVGSPKNDSPNLVEPSTTA